MMRWRLSHPGFRWRVVREVSVRGQVHEPAHPLLDARELGAEPVRRRRERLPTYRRG